MKRFDRDPSKINVLEIFNILSQKEGYSITDNESLEKFLLKLKTGLENAKNNPITLHGVRIQELFMHILASLGECSLIKQEDSGELLHNETEMRLPDLRVILKNNTEMFIEVKNFRPKNLISDRYKLKSKYVESLLKYTNKFGKELKFAIYWSQMNIWTLLSLKSFKRVNSNYEIEFIEAYKSNEMSTVGDYMLATIPPLKFIVLTDPNKKRTIGKDRKVGFTVSKIELYAKDILIKDKKESQIAFFLILNSDWTSDEPNANIKDGELISIDFLVKPEEAVPNQYFQMLGYLSTMISRQFNSITAPKGEIEKISPSNKHGSLGIKIPQNYKGKYLPLWRFKIKI